MSTSWRKIETEQGFPYYYNEGTRARQWDHPDFTEIKQKVDECNYIKLPTFRVAFKIRTFQNSLHTNKLALGVVRGVFERHRLGTNEGALGLDPYDLEAVLSDIFFAVKQQDSSIVDVDYTVQLMQNFLYNIFDSERLGQIQVSSAKLALAILSGDCSLTEFNEFFFNLCADHNSCVSRLKLQGILTKLVDIFTYLHEDVIFGHHLVNSSIENCFSKCPGLVGVNESSFFVWLESSPQLLSWIPNLQRIKKSELAVHFYKCSTCGTSPIVGLRYKCIKCSKFTQCQVCFFTCRKGGSHKGSHRMKEYSSEGNSSRDSNSSSFFVKLFRLFPCPSKNSLNPENAENNQEQKSNDKEFLIKPQYSVRISRPCTQLQSVINNLKERNRELQQVLLVGSHNETEMRKYLEDLHERMERQIFKLNLVMDHMVQSPPKNNQNQAVASTPMTGTNNRHFTQRNLDMFSPIKPSTILENSIGESTTQISIPPSINDVSTWIGLDNEASCSRINSKNGISCNGNQKTGEFLDIDNALAQLQRILENNIILDDDSLGNDQLKDVVNEVEGVVTNIVDSIESTRASSVQSTN